ncbi:unnamed protein product [Mytilus coruscus]|uniref:Zinc finger PHD-type domain-containing protein n=1 Tax=Mytilus coruscus TaxID=42192 RepID=A0A6J8BXI5_MYTCO|nr:unnamed protein product [Mytilus coruscus]
MEETMKMIEKDRNQTSENTVCTELIKQTDETSSTQTISQVQSFRQDMQMQDDINICLCPICKEESQENTIACDECNEWYHYSCLRLTTIEVNRMDPDTLYIYVTCVTTNFYMKTMIKLMKILAIHRSQSLPQYKIQSVKKNEENKTVYITSLEQRIKQQDEAIDLLKRNMELLQNKGPPEYGRNTTVDSNPCKCKNSDTGQMRREIESQLRQEMRTQLLEMRVKQVEQKMIQFMCLNNAITSQMMLQSQKGGTHFINDNNYSTREDNPMNQLHQMWNTQQTGAQKQFQETDHLSRQENYLNGYHQDRNGIYLAGYINQYHQIANTDYKSNRTCLLGIINSQPPFPGHAPEQVHHTQQKGSNKHRQERDYNSSRTGHLNNR